MVLSEDSETILSVFYQNVPYKTASADIETTVYVVGKSTQYMEPKDIVAVGILLVLIPLVLTLLSSIWIIPIGLFILFIGISLYLFKQYHERRMSSESKQIEQTNYHPIQTQPLSVATRSTFAKMQDCERKTINGRGFQQSQVNTIITIPPEANNNYGQLKNNLYVQCDDIFHCSSDRNCGYITIPPAL